MKNIIQTLSKTTVCYVYAVSPRLQGYWDNFESRAIGKPIFCQHYSKLRWSESGLFICWLNILGSNENTNKLKINRNETKYFVLPHATLTQSILQ